MHERIKPSVENLLKMEITYRYDSETQIFYKTYSGDVSFQDVMDSWNEIIGSNSIPDGTTLFLLDYLSATYLPAEHGVKELVKFYKAYNHIFVNCKMALLMDKPDQVIVPILVGDELPTTFFKPFCTQEAAVTWLKKNNSD